MYLKLSWGLFLNFFCVCAFYTCLLSVSFSETKSFYKIIFDSPEVYTITTKDTFKLIGDPSRKEFIAPLPPNTDYQVLKSFSCDKTSVQTKEVSEYSRGILKGDFSFQNKLDASQKNNLILTYVVQFTRRSLCFSSEPQEIKHIQDDFLYLKSDETLDWQKKDFKEWLRRNALIKAPDELPLDFCLRVFKLLCDTGRYKYPPQCLWKASDIIDRKRLDIVGDCGVFSIVFVSICRANNIPARMLSGRWVQNLNGGKGLNARDVKTHVYCEFFDSSIGWVPVDVASSLLYASPSDPLQYFGSDPKTPFLTLHFDSDLKFRFSDNQIRDLQWLLFPYLYEQRSKWLIPGEIHFMGNAF